MSETPAAAERAFERHEAFTPAGDTYAVETTRFSGHVTASEGEEWRTDFEVTVRAPTLQAATSDAVGEAVADGWLETFARRLEDAPKATRAEVDLTECSVVEDGEEVVVTYRFSLGNAGQGADVAKAFVEYVQGTYVEGIIPGYDYVGTVADLMESASTGGSEGGRGGTPL